MYGKMKDHLSKTLAEIKEAGLYKEERLIESAQQAAITVKGKEVLNFCANNYLGLSNHPRLIAAAQNMMERRDKLVENVNYFRDKMTAAGFDIKPTQSAICAVMLYDAKLSQVYAARMQEEGIYVTGFYYPVVPKGQARIRVQISAGHNKEHLDKCIEAFIKVGKELGVLK